MESAAAELFFILVAVYLVDCFRWVARSAVVLRAVPLWGASMDPPWQVGAQFRRALAFGFPLPVGSLFSGEPLPVRPGPGGVLVPVLGERSWSMPSTRDLWVGWDAIGSLTVAGLELHGPEGLLHSFGSRGAAKATAQLLQTLAPLAKAGEGKRKKALAQLLAKRFEPGEAAEQLRKWRRLRRPLAAANLLLFSTAFGALGILSFARWSQGPSRLLVLVVLAWAAAVLVTVLTVRRALPREAWPTRGQWLVTLLSPLSLMRSTELVETELVAGVEPAVLATLLLPADEARAALAQWRRELLHPVCPEGLVPLDPLAQASVDWLREQLVERLDALGRTLPIAKSKDEAALPTGLHCPRCLTPYVGAAQACTSCPGVRLVA